MLKENTKLEEGLMKIPNLKGQQRVLYRKVAVRVNSPEAARNISQIQGQFYEINPNKAKGNTQ